MRLMLTLSLMWTASCARPTVEQEETRSWAELCARKHPGCELEGLDFSPYGEEVCKCKKPAKPVKSKYGDPGDFHP